MRSRPAGGGGGRVCRGGERGEESPGEGGTEPRLRARQVGARPGLSGAPSPPGTATSSAGWTREEGGGCGEGTNAEGTVGGFGGSLTASPGAVGPHVPQKPLRLLLPLLFCLRRRRLPRVPLPPPPPELEPELEPPPRPPPPPLRRSRASSSRAPPLAPRPRPCPAVLVPGAAPPLVHSRSENRGAKQAQRGHNPTPSVNDWNSQY